MRISDHELYFKNVPKDLTKAQYYELMGTFTNEMPFDEIYRKWYACFRYILKSYKLGFTTKAIDSLFHDFDMCNWHFVSVHVEEPKDTLLEHFCDDAAYISDRTSYDRLFRTHWCFITAFHDELNKIKYPSIYGDNGE